MWFTVHVSGSTSSACRRKAGGGCCALPIARLFSPSLPCPLARPLLVNKGCLPPPAGVGRLTCRPAAPAVLCTPRPGLHTRPPSPVSLRPFYTWLDGVASACKLAAAAMCCKAHAPPSHHLLAACPNRLVAPQYEPQALTIPHPLPSPHAALCWACCHTCWCAYTTTHPASCTHFPAWLKPWESRQPPNRPPSRPRLHTPRQAARRRWPQQPARHPQQLVRRLPVPWLPPPSRRQQQRQRFRAALKGSPPPWSSWAAGQWWPTRRMVQWPCA